MAIQLLQKHNLSEGPLGISGILEGIEILLQSNNFLGSFIDGFPNDTVGTLTKLLENLVLFQNVSFDFFSHFQIN